MSETSLKLTHEDLLELPDDGKRYELIDGELIVNPSPLTKHQRVSHVIARELGNYVEDHRIGFVFEAVFDVVLSEENVVEPDIIFISSERRHIITKTNIQGAPDLVVEIISDSSRRRDRIVKRNLYDRYGVAEYWIPDPAVDVIEIYRRAGGKFERAEELRAEKNDVLTSPLFPGFSLELTRIFAEPWLS